MDNVLKSLLTVMECDKDGNPTPESLQVAREMASMMNMDEMEKEIDKIEMGLYRKREEENDE